VRARVLTHRRHAASFPLLLVQIQLVSVFSRVPCVYFFLVVVVRISLVQSRSRSSVSSRRSTCCKPSSSSSHHRHLVWFLRPAMSDDIDFRKNKPSTRSFCCHQAAARPVGILRNCITTKEFRLSTVVVVVVVVAGFYVVIRKQHPRVCIYSYVCPYLRIRLFALFARWSSS